MKGKITIVGLGSSDENHLSLGVYRLFKKSNNIYLRTRIHPVVDFFISEVSGLYFIAAAITWFGRTDISLKSLLT